MDGTSQALVGDSGGIFDFLTDPSTGRNPVYDFLLGPQNAPDGTIPLFTASNSPLQDIAPGLFNVASIPWYVWGGIAVAAFLILRK
jgi:hypothetical protein